jgi:hypothetical protein
VRDVVFPAGLRSDGDDHTCDCRFTTSYVADDSFCYNSNKALRFRDNAAFVLIRAKEQQTYLFIAPTSLPLGATDMGLFAVGGLAVGQKKGVGQVGPARTGIQS